MNEVLCLILEPEKASRLDLIQDKIHSASMEVGALIGSSEGNLSYPLQCVTFQNFISFIISPVMCWNFRTGLPDFH